MTARIRWERVGAATLATWFITLSVMRIATQTERDPSRDVRIYLRAASAWLRGEDPYAVHIDILSLAAPPPALLPMAPFTFLPEDVAVVVLTALGIAASFWTLRRLSLPWWWITWPPLVDNLWNGNPQLFVVPLLIGPAAWLAPIVKAYAIVPMLIQWRVRTLAVTAVLGLITLPILPWPIFLERLSALSALLSRQSMGGMSAWFLPILVPFTIVALFLMGRPHASWWSVPALWPSTQWYYSLMAMPVLTPVTAAILAAPVQGGPALAAMVAAIEVWYVRRKDRQGDQPAATTSDGLTARAPSS